MAITLIDESEVKPIKQIPKKIEKVNIKLELVQKENVKHCERVAQGGVCSCSSCQALRKEVFDRCNNKWNYDEF